MTRRLLAGTGALWLALTAGLAADYRSEFRDGVRALNRRDAAEAIRRFRQAIGEQPQDTGESINISGGDFQPYLPHALLGLALYQSTGRCDQALPEFQISRGQNAPWTRLKTHLVALEKAVVACPAVPVPPLVATVVPDPAIVRAATQRADKAVTDAADVERQVTDLSRNALLQPQWAGNARLAPALTRAQSDLGRARKLLEDARKASDPVVMGQAEEAATRARTQFEGIRAAANEALAVATAAAQPSQPAQPTDPGGKDPVKPIETTTPTVTTGGVTVRNPVAVPPTLLSAAGQFFKAQYVDAATSLRVAKFDRREDELQAQWFQAAAHYALYLVSGKKDDAARQRAITHVQACRRLDPKFLPDKRFFSPALVAFYQSTR